MNTSKQVLWLDNDSPYVRPYVLALRNHDYVVTVVTSVTEAESSLFSSMTYDLIILDVMIPTRSEAEEADYPFTQTDMGHKTGLVFYHRIRERLGAKLPPLIIMTVRLDQAILDEFVAEGLKRENFFTKFALRDVKRFLSKIDDVTKGRS